LKTNWHIRGFDCWFIWRRFDFADQSTDRSSNLSEEEGSILFIYYEESTIQNSRDFYLAESWGFLSRDQTMVTISDMLNHLKELLEDMEILKELHPQLFKRSPKMMLTQKRQFITKQNWGEMTI
jgi:hypothetical protein